MSAALLLTLLAGSPAPINAVVGDLSWVQRFGAPPPAGVEQTMRIQVHLGFVERVLRSRDVSHLDAAQRARRTRALDDLGAYQKRGVFPRRGDDGLGPRRPRFIDDRGVHCAVGALITASGHPELSAAINARYEHAYVWDIAMPELAAWAVRHGFTAQERAMIQPGYDSVPSVQSTRAALAAAADAFALKCGREHRTPTEIEVHVRGLDDASALVSSESNDPFVRCFVALAQQVERGGGAYEDPIRTYHFDARIPIRSPRRILRSRVKRLRLDTHTTNCTPRPGPLVDHVAFEVEVGERGVLATVRTTPENPEVSTCLTRYLERALRDFEPGSWRLRSHGERWLNRRVSRGRIENILRSSAPYHATKCATDAVPATPVTVTVLAALDAPGFEVSVSAPTPSFRSCLQAAVAEALLRDHAVSRRLDDGEYERYFRIDADATASFTFEVESSATRKKRDEEMMRHLERDRYGL